VAWQLLRFWISFIGSVFLLRADIGGEDHTHPVNAFLKIMNGTFILGLSASALLAAAAETTSNPRFKFEPINDKSLQLLENGQPVFVYNHGFMENETLPNSRRRSSYLHPVYGLDGEILTDDFPKDHDYHRGVYWAWSHIKIEGQEYDSWSLRGIRTEFARWISREVAPDKAVLSVENGWFVGSKKVMDEQVLIETHAASSNSRAIDIQLTWAPTDSPLTLAGAEGKGYGGFTMRFGPRTKTMITAVDGLAKEDLLMAKLPWADFAGDFRKGSDDLSGAAIFVHPSHPDFPPMWMTRHYGLLAVGWPGVTAQTLAPGKPVTCRYRLWIHRGVRDAAEIQTAYDQYRAVPLK
jgi:hypothetical protein